MECLTLTLKNTFTFCKICQQDTFFKIKNKCKKKKKARRNKTFFQCSKCLKINLRKLKITLKNKRKENMSKVSLYHRLRDLLEAVKQKLQ